MVDASVGGKTGVDLPQGKNLVGAFKQPQMVLADMDTLATLPKEEFTSGMAEVAKAGLIASTGLLERLKEWCQQSKGIDNSLLLQTLLIESILIKKRIVEADPFESGVRQVLNLGHTFGHAIEQVSGFTIRHGEGVGIGLVAATNLSKELGYCQDDLVDQVVSLVTQLNLPTRIPRGMDPIAIFQAMGADKKKAGRHLNFILIRNVGDVFVSDQVPSDTVIQVLVSMTTP
jgi:3-dehydroquinate synthetase